MLFPTSKITLNVVRVTTLVVVLAAVLSGCSTNPARKFADIHIHYNFSQEEVTTPKQAIAVLKKHNIAYAVVSSEPTDYAVKLAEQGGPWIIPFASPYYKAGNKLTWYRDKKLVNELRKLLLTGKYKGIGELHLTAGLGPRPTNKVLVGILKLAQEFKLPFLIHIDSSDHRYMQYFCKKYPDIRFIWAHAGGYLVPEKIHPLMQACSNVWLDLAARDPWHYGGLTSHNNKLTPAWRALMIKYQNKIMTGTDPVWNAQQAYRWYEADEGWNHYEKFIKFHRHWLSQLPPQVAEKIRLSNAVAFFGIKDKRSP